MDFPDLKKTLVRTMRLDALSGPAQEKFLDSFTRLVGKRILLELTAALPTDKRDEFLNLFEQEDKKPLAQFLTVHLPAYPAIIENAVNIEVKAYYDALKKSA